MELLQWTLANKFQEALRKSGAIGKNKGLSDFKYPQGLASFYKRCLSHSLPRQIFLAATPLVKEVENFDKIKDKEVVIMRENLRKMIDRVGLISSNVNIFAQIQFENAGGDKNIKIGLDFPKVMLKKRIGAIPDLMVVTIDDAMKQIPDLQEQLLEITFKTKELKDIKLDVNKDDIEKWLGENEKLYTSAKIVSAMSGTVESLTGLIANASPRDLSLSVAVLGEGGGTQIIGHPAHWSIEVLKQVLNYCKKACDSYIDFYNDYVIMARHLEVINNQNKILNNQNKKLNKLTTLV